jgi:hypothetical protein
VPGRRGHDAQRRDRQGPDQTFPAIDGSELARIFPRGTVVSVERFLKQRAVNIAVDGSYTLPNWYDCEGRLRTFACRTTRVSPFRMILDVPVVGKIGDRLTSYFREFGKFGGHISDTRDGSFLLNTTLALADGSIHSCRVIDVSPSGVAVSSDIQPPVGTPLAIGGCVGRVIRAFQNGFAVKFVETHKLADLIRLISRESAPGRKLRESAPAEKVPA